MNPVTCGADSLRSIVSVSPAIVTLCPYGNQLGVETVVVHECLPVVLSVGPVRYEAPDLRLSRIEDAFYYAGQPV